MDRAALDDVVTRLHQLVTQFHAHNPLVAGISKESLREQARVTPEVFEFALMQASARIREGTTYSRAANGLRVGTGMAESRALPGFDTTQNPSAEKKLEMTGELVRLPGRGVVMKDEESESRKIIEQTFAAAGLKVPALKDVLAGLKIDQSRAHKIMTLLLREKILIKVSDDLVFHQSALVELRKSLAERKLRSSRIDVAGFKELTGV